MAGTIEGSPRETRLTEAGRDSIPRAVTPTPAARFTLLAEAGRSRPGQDYRAGDDERAAEVMLPIQLLAQHHRREDDGEDDAHQFAMIP